jgi:hypothetical protein
MRKTLCVLLFASAVITGAQVPSPQVPVTGKLGAGGNFPVLNAGSFAIPTDANYTVVYPNTTCISCTVTSSVALTATRNVVMPAGYFIQNVCNYTTGGQSIQVIGTTGTGAVITNGTCAWVKFDGTNWVLSGGGSGISLTTSGTSGAATLSGGVLNVPQYQGVLTLTTTGSSGASTLIGNTLNIPQYAGGSSTVVANQPYLASSSAGGVIPGPMSAIHQYLGANAFGDSTTQSYGAVTVNDGWVQQIFAGLGCQPTMPIVQDAPPALYSACTNWGHGGDYVADTANTVYKQTNPTANNNRVAILEDMINDYIGCQVGGGVAAGCQANAAMAFLAESAWLAIPNNDKIIMGSNTQAVTTTGTWTEDSTFQSNLALQTIVNGSTLTFTTFTPSTAVYVTWMGYVSGGSTATAALSCDSGAVTDTLLAYGYDGQAISHLTSITGTPLTKRYTFSSATTHVCTITASASTGNPFSVIWAGTAAPAGYNNFANLNNYAPMVYTSGVPQYLNSEYSTISAIYDGIASATVATLYGDGWQDHFENVRAAIDPVVGMSGSATTLANGCVIPGSSAPGPHPNGGEVTCNGSTTEMGGYAQWAAVFLADMLPASNPLYLAKTVEAADYSLAVNTQSGGSGNANPGICWYHGTPNDACTFFMNSGAGYTVDSVMPGPAGNGWNGWRFCGHSAVPVTNVSTYTGCATIPNTYPGNMNANVLLGNNFYQGADQFSNLSNQAVNTGAIGSGLNLWYNGTGQSYGIGIGNIAGAVFAMNYQPSYGSGWIWGNYSGGTDFTATSQLTGYITLPNPGSSNHTIAFLDSPAFTGVPTAPTATTGTNTTQLATTAFVQAAISGTTPGTPTAAYGGTVSMWGAGAVAPIVESGGNDGSFVIELTTGTGNTCSTGSGCEIDVTFGQTEHFASFTNPQGYKSSLATAQTNIFQTQCYVKTLTTTGFAVQCFSPQFDPGDTTQYEFSMQGK